MTFTACSSSSASRPRLSSSPCTWAILRRYQSGSRRSWAVGGAATESLSTRVRPNRRVPAVSATEPATVRRKSRRAQKPALSSPIQPPKTHCIERESGIIPGVTSDSYRAFCLETRIRPAREHKKRGPRTTRSSGFRHSAASLHAGFSLHIGLADGGDEVVRRCGYLYFPGQHLVRGHYVTVNLTHGIFVRLDDRAFQVHPGKHAFAARIGQNGRVHLPIHAGGSMSPHRACRSGSRSPHLEPALQQLVHALLVHDHHHQVNAFHSDLRSPASSTDGEELGRAPPRGRAADGEAFAVLGAKHETAFQHVRHYRHALGFVEYFVGNAFVRRGHDLVQHLAGFLHSFGGRIGEGHARQ